MFHNCIYRGINFFSSFRQISQSQGLDLGKYYTPKEIAKYLHNIIQILSSTSTVYTYLPTGSIRQFYSVDQQVRRFRPIFNKRV